MFHIASDDVLPAIPDTLSPLAKDFLVRCFVKNPSARPSAAELSQHPFIATSSPSPLDSTQVETVDEPASARSEKPEADGHDIHRADVANETAVGDEVSSSATFRSGTCRAMSTRSTESRNSDRNCALLSGSAESGRSVPALTNRDPLGEDKSSDEGSCASFSSSLDGASSDSQISDDGDDGDDDGVSAEYSSGSDDSGDDVDAPHENTTVSDYVNTTSSREQPAPLQPQVPVGIVRATADYSSADASELSLVEGEIVEVLEMRASGWWRGRQRRAVAERAEWTVGWFPSTYGEWLPSDDVAFTVKKAHTPDPGDSGEELALRVGDVVHVYASEWRDGCLWAKGSTSPSDTVGWFPFDSITDA